MPLGNFRDEQTEELVKNVLRRSKHSFKNRD